MRVLAPKQYAFDTTGVHPDNLVLKEPLTLDPDTGESVVIPKYGPFYAQGFKLYSPDGKLLIKEEDYRFYHLMSGLTAFTNKPVVGMVELLKPELKKVLATYHCLGDTDFWDSSLIKLAINAAEDDRPVYWENLHDKPLGYPSDIHGHSFIYQLTAFSDFVKFTEELLEAADDAPDLIEWKTRNLVPLIDSSITRYKEMLEDLVSKHDQAYNAHGLTKAQIGLGNVDNFPTATMEQAKLGESNQLHLTPPGLAAIINEFGYDESRLLENDVLPMSMYGNRNFIPPSMDGSYEAMGCTINRGVYCIEEDGSLAVLSPRYDGKTAGVYFSRITDFNDPAKIKFSYTAVKYDHTKLKQDGVAVTNVAGGSDFQVLMVGDNTDTGMYITLTNGTFNAEKHELKHIDTSKVSLPTSNLGSYTVAYLGDRVAVMIHLSRAVGYNTESIGRVKMFYILVDDLLNTNYDKVELRDWFINYNMPDGTIVTNDQYLNLSPMEVSDTDPGKMKKLYYTFAEPLPISGGGYRSCNIVGAINPNNENQSVINVARSFYSTYRDSNGVTRAIGMLVNEVIWTRIGDQFTLSDCTPIEDPYLGNLGITMWPNANTRVAAFYLHCTSMLSNGQRATTYSGNGNSGANSAALIEMCNKTPFEWLSKCSYTKNHTLTATAVKELFTPPTKRGPLPIEMTWTRDGYITTHLSPTTGGVVRTQVKLHDTNAKSNLPFHNWEIRPETTVSGGASLSLPIPTPEQELPVSESFAEHGSNLTGDAAFCVSVSTGYGLNIKGNCGNNAGRNGMAIYPPSLHSGGDDGVLLYDNAEEILYYPATIIDQLKTLVGTDPTIHPIKGVSVCNLTGNVNKNNGYVGSWDPNLAIVLVHYGRYSPAAPSKYVQMFIIRPVISANVNGLYNPLYTRIVTGFMILDTMGERQMTSSEAQMSATTWDLFARVTTGSQRRLFQGYVSGNRLDFAFETTMYSAVIGNGHTTSVKGSLDLTTGLITNPEPYNLGPAWNTNASLAIPRIGLMQTNVTPISYGGCAWITPGGATRLCIYNTYLKDGWFIYVGETDVVFNGRVYPMATQTIDVRQADPNYTNTLFYIYVKLQNKQPVVYLSKSKLPDTVFHMWIGTCETDGGGIKTITRQNVLSLNGIRLGTGRGGSTIMASAGSVNSYGSIPWFSRDDVV